jgi:glycopeptide antibiotics resistance protein
VWRKVYAVCLIAYSVVIAWFTLRSYPVADGAVDIVPFVDTWQKMREAGDRVALREVVANFALFVPLGYFVQGALRPRLRASCAIGALASIGVETFQAVLATGRNPSIDDVMFNTAGAAVGASLFVLLNGAVRWRRARQERSAAAQEH